MSLTLTGLTSPHVLVTDPGPRVAEMVHELLDQGATVSVRHSDEKEPNEVTTTLADLAGRRLITLVGTDGPAAYDIVLRDPRGPAARTGPQPTAPEQTGRVVLVGGGPGDVGLLTLRGLAAVRAADVLVCDRLAPLAVLAQARPQAQVIHVGKIPRGAFTPQEAINTVLVEHALAGRNVVRLKGGDNYVFGRGGEEWNACVAAGVPVEVVPGVTSAVAVPALAGIPVTHRGLSQGFVVVSGHVAPGDPRSDVDWVGLARSGLTLVLLMGVAALADIATTLIAAGMDPLTPAACIADGSMPSQRHLVATLESIAQAAQDNDLTPPSVTVIGPVVTALATP